MEVSDRQISIESSTTEIKLVSEEYVPLTMPRILGTFDMTAVYLMIIFFITNATTAAGGGAAAFTYLLIGGITFFLPAVAATAQLGVLFPNEGALYNWTHKVLGGYWSFFAAFCAWFPGVLVMVTAGDVIVGYLQGLNSQWLVQPWQQGLVLIFFLAFSGVIAVQRFRTVQNIVNVVIMLTFLGVLLIGIAGVVWLVKGNQPVTSFHHLSDWMPNPGNYSLFGLVTLAYLGMDTALNMGGEITETKVIKKHLLWGTLLVLLGYFVATFSLLVVEGPVNGAIPFALVSLVDITLGKFAGNITAICLMSFFVLAAVVYNYAYARLLLVAGIDKRLPINMGKLNKHRIPANAIILQTIVAGVVAAFIFLIFPYVLKLNNPVNLSTEVYNVILASSTLVWALSSLFLFVNLALIYFRDRSRLLKQLIFPRPVLWLCIVLGSISCVIAIADSLFFSWIGLLIDNAHWWYIIGGITFIFLVFAAIGSMLASSEIEWQKMNE